jgi:hypothetical protein
MSPATLTAPAGNGRDRRRARLWLAALDVSRYGILK